MYSRIRKRITYANVAMTLVLVFAMSGGAYAASRYVITSTKQISPKVLKALKGANGKNGVSGVAGAQGTQGPQGPAGSKGETGAAGANGTNGTNGTNGVSVTSKAVQPGAAACNKAGGSEFSSSSGKTFACNGNPAELPEVLPSKKTLRGVWAAEAGTFGVEGSYVWATGVSFPLRIENSAGHAPEPLYIKENASDPPGCTGSAAEPGAEPGHLCVFATTEEHVASGVLFGPTIQGDSPFGFRISGGSEETEAGVSINGTWAVTAE